MGSKSALPAASGNSAFFISGLLLLVWFAASVASTLTNKTLIDHFPYPVTITAIHMTFSVLVDAAVIRTRKMPFLPVKFDIFYLALPVAFTITIGKVLTYVSYEFVTASLTHTAKASAPLFSVLLTKLLFHQIPKFYTCCSLIPLSLGVILSAFTEMEIDFLGFLAAISAALASVLNSLYSKKALEQIPSLDPLVFHMYTATTAISLLIPWAIMTESTGIRSGAHLNAPITAASAGSAFFTSSPILLIPLSLIFHYLQNISSIYFLSHVTVLTHQVAQTLKRLFVISGSVWFFHTPVTRMNLFGMALAIIGFFSYSLAKNYDRIHHQQQQQQRKSDILLHPPGDSPLLKSIGKSPILLGNGGGISLRHSNAFSLQDGGLHENPVEYSSDSDTTVGAEHRLRISPFSPEIPSAALISPGSPLPDDLNESPYV